MNRSLAIRLDAVGDVLVTGPAVRAMAVRGPVDLLASPAGEAAARLLPGVDDVLIFDPPWSGYQPPPTNPRRVERLISAIRRRRYSAAVVFTSFHQSPLPVALLLRLAGVPSIAAISVDYPGSLLDVRHARCEGHEVTAALDLAAAAGFPRPAGDDGRLAVRRPLPDVGALVPEEPYVVVHPTASVPARSLPGNLVGAVCERLLDDGWAVVVTGAGDDPVRHGATLPPGAIDLTGRTDLATLAGVLAGAMCAVACNSGPAHLAAAVGTPVVSLFSPVVPAERWRPFGVPTVLLGDQRAPCAGTRARECPVRGHPCLSGISPDRIADAVRELTGRRTASL